jgi:hypothetical protein
VISAYQFFYADTSAHSSGMFIVFGPPLAAIGEQGHSVSLRFEALRASVTSTE